MVSLANKIIYVDLAPIYTWVAESMESVGADSPIYYLKVGEYDGLIQHIAWLGLLVRSGSVSRCAAQIALQCKLRSLRLTGHTCAQQQLLRVHLGTSREFFHVTQETFPLSINPTTLIAPDTGTIWAIITGA
ncbi:hypothetical protein PHOBOS_12 [Erwinia phage vB_EamM_Phobos]|uniref:hypothetical protein n=1 Tax=Erwinia phage vB_EamM_Phobos TaxID=1883377 RepID=UPI00081CE92F|nr:hypothetical protein BIZ79_gp012 [Erwinia phage vB_EamM_Phobos]ANZ50202.1 hypothetical protein PHOBOS_12 [Erwinia phage vB_EamM_Phobos]